MKIISVLAAAVLAAVLVAPMAPVGAATQPQLRICGVSNDWHPTDCGDTFAVGGSLYAVLAGLPLGLVWRLGISDVGDQPVELYARRVTVGHAPSVARFPAPPVPGVYVATASNLKGAVLATAQFQVIRPIDPWPNVIVRSGLQGQVLPLKLAVIGQTVRRGDPLVFVQNTAGRPLVASRAMTSGTVIDVLVRPGDVVNIGDPVAVIERQ